MMGTFKCPNDLCDFSTAAFGEFSDIFKEGVVRSSLYTAQGVYFLYRLNFFA
jgi:hypothetical protein